MARSSNYDLIILIFVITLISAIAITVGRGTILYQKTWSTDRGSELRIDVNPNTASFQPEKIYSYTFTLTAVKFGSDVDRFHEIYIYLEFLNAREEISVNDGYYEVPNVGSQYQVVLDLIIPSDETLSLDAGDSLSGKLQFKVDFKEGVVLAIDPSYSTGWETIVDGDISVPSDYSTLIIVGGLGLVVIVGGLVIFYFIKPKKPVMEYAPPVAQVKSQLQPRKGFCPHCGKPTEPTDYCSSCGGKLN